MAIVTMTGAEKLQENLTRFEEEWRASVARSINRTGMQMLKLLHRNTSRAFQEVPSYLQEYRRNPKIGAKRYPPGTVATFSHSGPELDDTPWEGRVQQYKGAARHPINQALKFEPADGTGTDIVGEVGYTAEDAAAHPEIKWVMFGTQKMQPRPFLIVAEFAAQEPFLQDMIREMRALTRGGVLGSLSRVVQRFR